MLNKRLYMSCTAQEKKQIESIAKKLDLSTAEVVRECVLTQLHMLLSDKIESYTKDKLKIK